MRNTCSLGLKPQPVDQAPQAAAIFIVGTFKNTPESHANVRQWCAAYSGLIRAVGHRAPEGQLRCVVGFGSSAWDRIFGHPRPDLLHPFIEYGPAERRAIATPGDVLLHISAQRMDLCIELATHLVAAFGNAFEIADEVHGFRHFDMRSIIGFVDGTENPSGQDALEATVIPDTQTVFAGGSYAIIQKYLHDMIGWNALSTEMQERIIGRTKLSDIELDEDTKPSWAHNALTVIEDDTGEEIDIMRGNMPFGRPGHGEFGTYFIGYASSPTPIERMMENMFVGNPPGNYDRLLDFSTAVTGGLFFIPSLPLLETLAQRPSLDEAENINAFKPALTVSHDGSLSIGSLKGESQHE
ncbi:Dyp-type peroxidase [Lampropedia puyangensis]|uniref:Dyp-type peroxidase n=1 Tax=Lampropedia puyangensis TaxID=1330072 RepID=A0A4S8EZB9_9BURK|nr:Dyp-type peroxidase [Lampropedia puyangensis]THT99294.1 Dyp-type peroxidase [Lampropedia puyangensis]